MPLPRPTVIIFDMDGTTVRHLNPWVLHFLEMGDDLLFGLRKLGTRIGKAMGYGIRLRVRRTTRKPRLIVHRVLHKIRRKPVEQIVEPCPGIIDLLELFHAHKIPVGLVSNGLGEGYGYDILRKFQLEHLFAACVFREDTQRAKPDPEPIVAVLNRLKPSLSVDDCIWYVGDRAKDVAAALSAMPHVKAHIVPIGYGLHAAMALFEQNLDSSHLVLSYEDWYPVVDDLLGPVAIPSIAPSNNAAA